MPRVLILALLLACRSQAVAEAPQPVDPAPAAAPAAPTPAPAAAPDPGAAAAPEAPPPQVPEASAWQPATAEQLREGGVKGLVDLRARPDHKIDGNRAEFLFRGPQLWNVQGLDLSGQPLGTLGGKAIAASDDLPALVELRLRGCQLGNNGVRAIAYAPQLPALERLDLSNNDAGAIAVQALADARYLGQLKALDLRGNAPPSPEAAGRLGRSLSRVEELRVDASWPTPVLHALREGLGVRATALRTD